MSVIPAKAGMTGNCWLLEISKDHGRTFALGGRAFSVLVGKFFRRGNFFSEKPVFQPRRSDDSLFVHKP